MTIVTKAWFFAAERTIVGPPMSISSIASERSTPGRATVSSKGYKLTHTRSIGPIPCSSIAWRWEGSSRRASSPPWIFGCSVLTRPSIISGKPVTSETSRTGIPASAMSLRVPPVARISTPSSLRARANSAQPVLSETLKRARVTFVSFIFRRDAGRRG